jgi:NhaA family Na+:H+ antiporter
LKHRPFPLSPAERLILPFQRFAQAEAASGVVLIACALVALVWANSPAGPGYFSLWNTPVVIELGPYRTAESLGHWINDGLMVVFFLMVGLEIKREILSGELASPRRAALPLAAAVGGMIVPALIFAALNDGGTGQRGWGVPMATDIAFAMGVLALVGKRAPLGLKVFLAAVAIVDDLGAVLVIALFYSDHLKLAPLAAVGGLLVVLIVLNVTHVRRPLVYLLVGVALWTAVLQSGVHATIAGVLLALAIPDRRRIDAAGFVAVARAQVDRLARRAPADRATALGADELESVETLEKACEAVQTPLRRLEHALVPWVAWVIMPLFALANAGVAVGRDGLALAARSPISLGVLLGLIVGKPTGVMAFSWLSVRLRAAELPEEVSWRALFGACLLCGIGFTMALFIADLAFDDAQLLDAAKIGVLAGSFAAAILGLTWLVRQPGTGSG